MRRAFTLIELLVVLAIIALMGALLAFTLPGFIDRSRAANGAASVQGWLAYARQRAQAEERPTGLRFHIEKDDAGKYIVRRFEYIQKPDDWNHGTPLVPSSPPDPAFVVVSQRDASDKVMNNGEVTPLDYLEIGGVGQVHVISSIVPSSAAKPDVIDKIVLGSPLPNPITSNIASYRVMRAARVTGDEPMMLPDRVFIDMAMFTKYSAQAASHGAITPPIVTVAGEPAHFDILFSASGQAMNVAGDKTILWIRMDARNATEFDRNPTLLVITTATGAVSAYDPSTAADPFVNVK